MSELPEDLDGGCTCGAVRYRLRSKPLIVHCCHCTFCQRQTGTAFAINALIESEQVELLKGEVSHSILKTPSGDGQRIARCPECLVALWSEYLIRARRGACHAYFIRVGTLDHPEKTPPDVHIYTVSKQPWVVLPPDAQAVPLFYDYETTWPQDSKDREAQAKARPN